MSLTATLIVLVLAGALFGWANWDSRRERPPGQPSLIPHTVLQMLALIAIVLMAAHVVSLLSGTPLVGRRGV